MFPRAFVARRSCATAAVPTFYARLRVAPDATFDEIKKAYRRMVLECHPDVVSDPKEKISAEAAFRLVSEAYGTLRSETQRADYDRKFLKPKRQSKVYTRSSLEEELLSKVQHAVDQNDLRRRTAAPAYGHASRKWAGQRFLRKDADKVFSEEFDGKTLHDLLFASRYANKRKSSGSQNEMGAAASRAAREFHQKHPFANLREVRIVKASYRTEEPAQYPDLRIPFRPFIGMNLPQHVSYQEPVIPKPEYLLPMPCGSSWVPATMDPSAIVNSYNDVPLQIRMREQSSNRPRGVDDIYVSSDVMYRLQRENSYPHGMGMLRSMHRPW